MRFEQILEILADTTRTDYQKAADMHAALTAASKPSVLKVQPMKERKPRGPNKPKPVPEANGHAPEAGQ